MSARRLAELDVLAEMRRQDEQLGVRDLPFASAELPRNLGAALEHAAREAQAKEGKTWAAIALEEFGELLDAIEKGDVAQIRAENVQVSAVCQQMCRQIDREGAE